MSELPGNHRPAPSPDPRWDEAGDLVREVKAGNEEAFHAFVRRHWGGLVRYVLRFVDSEDQAEDMAQEALVRLWAGREGWRQEETLRPVVYQIARNLALNERRRVTNFRRWAQKLRGLEGARHPPPDRELCEADLESVVRAAIDGLTERRRDVFLLVRIHRMSYREAGTVLGIAPQTVANRMTQAMKDLREALEPFLRSADPEDIPFVRRLRLR